MRGLLAALSNFENFEKVHAIELKLVFFPKQRFLSP
jgi:hypothetical protein